MAFDEPSQPGEFDYRVYFWDATTDTDHEHKTHFTVTVDRTYAPVADTEVAVQRLMDLIATSPDFDGVRGHRTGKVHQGITPDVGS